MSLSRWGLYIAHREGKKLNKRVNKLFIQLGLPLRNKVQMDHYGRWYLFGIAINEKNTNDEIIQIIQSTPENSWYGHIGFFGEWFQSRRDKYPQRKRKISQTLDTIPKMTIKMES